MAKLRRLTSVLALVVIGALVIPSFGAIFGLASNHYAYAAQTYQTSDSLKGYVSVGAGPIAVLVYPPNGDVYVANSGSNTVTVLSPTNTVIATINVGTDPSSFAYDSHTNLIFLCDANNGYTPWEIQAIDPTTNTVVGTLSISSGAFCQSLATDPAIGVLFAASGNAIQVVGEQPLALIGNFPFNDHNYPNSDATALLFDSTNGYLYIGDYNGGVGVVTTPSATLSSDSISFVISMYGVGVLHGMALDPVSGMMYVITGGSGVLYNTQTNASYRFNNCAWYQSAGVAVDPVNGLFYVSNPAWPNRVFACEETVPPSSSNFLDQVTFGAYQYGNAFGVAYNPVNNLVYVTLQGQDLVAEITPATLVVTTHTTSTYVNCTPNPMLLNGASTCTVTVTDTNSGSQTTPTGSVSLSASAGVLSSLSCNLVQTTVGSATCSATLTGTSVGPSTVSASYGGDSGHYASSGSVNLQVIYHFGGFLAPLFNNGNYKVGRTIPVKFQLTDANGNYISTAVAKIYVDGNPGVSSGSSNSGNLFRYDSTSNQYIFNLSTTGLAVGPHTITVVLDDGMTYSVTINLR
ncbi:MAG: PxKF domain-containing protein [Nitrososphaerales archaeon]